MAEAGFAENEDDSTVAVRVPGSRDWLRHANQSLARLKDVKKTSYQLGGGPREREISCQCNYRSKNKSSYLTWDAEPPQLAVDSQETASMPDLSIPEIVKQFNERQLQKSKPKIRPHSSSAYMTKSSAKKKEMPSTYNHNAFITVKGQTVTPQLRPPHCSQPTNDTKRDDTAFKGLLYLDQQVERQVPTFEGLRKYSAAFGDDEDDPNDIPPPPRVSPEPDSLSTKSPEYADSVEDSFSEDDVMVEIINKSSETRPSSGSCRSLVFAIPTAGSEGGSDEETTVSDFKPGRISADYVRKSEALLDELNVKNQTEAVEISDMLEDMENAKERIVNLRISPRDLELESSTGQSTLGGTSPHPGRTGTSTSSVHVVNMEMESSLAEEDTLSADGLYETFWVEEPVGSFVPNALPSRNSHVCSARFTSQHTKDPVRVRKHQSESSLVLKGRTMEFFNSEDLLARNRLRDLRRTSENDDDFELGFTKEKSDSLEANVSRNKKVDTKPPLPKWDSAKNSKKQPAKQKPRSVGKNSGTDNLKAKSSLRKSNSDGNIHLSVTENELPYGRFPVKKSVTFSQNVLSQEIGDIDCSKSDNSADTIKLSTIDNTDEDVSRKGKLKTCSWSHPGVVIQNGLEMEGKNLQTQESLESSAISQATKEGHQHRKTQSTRAKLLAKMKEIPLEEESCACRTVTRPTAALLAEAKTGKTGMRETASRNVKLLKSRPTRPSSAPIKRSPASNELVAERPKSPRRKPRAVSATMQRKRTASEGAQTRPRPSSAFVGRSSSKDARRSRAAAKVLREGFLLKERPPPDLPPAAKERQQKREAKGNAKDDNNDATRLRTLSLNREEDDVVASEECQEVFSRLQEKGIDVSMETIKRGLMPPARKANDYNLAILGSSSGLLSRPENWLPEEHARVQIWEDVLKSSK